MLGPWLIVTPLLSIYIFGLHKVLYRPDGQHDGKLYSTHKHSIEVPIPRDGEYVVEVRAHSDGGDGVVSQVKISGKPSFGTHFY
jgi:receptor-type tyrosine-protein phosphatase zeta